MFKVDSFAPLNVPDDISMKTKSRNVRIQCLRVRVLGGFPHNVTSFLFAVKPANISRLADLDSPSPDNSFRSKTGIATGIVTDIKLKGHINPKLLKRRALANPKNKCTWTIQIAKVT